MSEPESHRIRLLEEWAQDNTDRLNHHDSRITALESERAVPASQGAEAPEWMHFVGSEVPCGHTFAGEIKLPCPRCGKGYALPSRPSSPPASETERCVSCNHPHAHHMADYGCYCGCKFRHLAPPSRPSSATPEPKRWHEGPHDYDGRPWCRLCRKAGEPVAALHAGVPAAQQWPDVDELARATWEVGYSSVDWADIPPSPRRLQVSDVPHRIEPDGPDCNPGCPGSWSPYHEGYVDGYWRATLAAPASPGPLLDRTTTLGEAWREAEAALPEGWRPITLAPRDPEDDESDEPWRASSASADFFYGVSDSDEGFEIGYGSTPAEALQRLAAALR